MPPPLCMLALGKIGEAAYSQELFISARRPLLTIECHVGACMISVLSLAVWWGNLKKNDKVRHNMTQIASLLAVATVFVGLWTLSIYILL